MHILPKFWLLKAIRDGVITERQFETCLGSIEGPDFHWFVSHLAELGAIRVHENGKIEPQEWISKCTATFGISLTEFEKYDTHLSVVANPEFRKPPNDSVAPDVFVVMPFDFSLKPIYDDHIKAVAANLNVTISRADDFFRSKAIMQDIWQAIYGAQVIIAECTGRNPNVFYKIGIAHTLGRPVVLISQDLNDVPFDLGHLRTIVYEYTPPGMKKFEDALAKTLTFEINEHELESIRYLRRALENYACLKKEQQKSE